MKRLITGLIIFLLSIVLALYIFVPSLLTIASTAKLNVPAPTANRVLSNATHWHKWTGTTSKNGDQLLINQPLHYKGTVLKISHIVPNAIDIMITQDDKQVASTLTIFPLLPDSCAVQWKTELPSGSTPWAKFRSYKQAIKLKQNLSHLLSAVANTVSTPAGVYGFNYTVESTEDTTLMATKSFYKNYPTSADIERNIERIQRYIKASGATQTAPPRLNITKTGGQYQAMVAIPVNRRLPEQGAIFYRKMIPGNFLVTQVQGGPSSIANAFEMMERYIADHQKRTMAIPFQILITDRTQETDTTRWITKLCYPILE